MQYARRRLEKIELGQIALRGVELPVAGEEHDGALAHVDYDRPAALLFEPLEIHRLAILARDPPRVDAWQLDAAQRDLPELDFLETATGVLHRE